MFSSDCVICGSPLQSELPFQTFGAYKIFYCASAGSYSETHYEIVFDARYQLLDEVVYYKINGFEIRLRISFKERETYINVVESGESIQHIIVPCYCRDLDKIKSYLMMA